MGYFWCLIFFSISRANENDIGVIRAISKSSVKLPDEIETDEPCYLTKQKWTKKESNQREYMCFHDLKVKKKKTSQKITHYPKANHQSFQKG